MQADDRTLVFGADEPPPRPIGRSLARGAKCRCPNCGEGALFDRYLKTVPTCSVCGEDLSGHRADDAPPYVTIVIVGHLLVPIMLFIQMETWLPDWVHLAIWLPLTALACIALLQPVKGAIVNLQWALRMHGFGDESDPSALPGAT